MPASANAYRSSDADSVAALHKLVLDSLDDDQAVDTISIPLAGKSSIADYMVVASGKSTRQVASMANKLAEKISPVMNAAELQQLIGDHYQGESQLLTTGAEENLLKLGELRGTLTEAQRARWQQIKADFLRNKAMGAEDADVGGRVVAHDASAATAASCGGRTKPLSWPWAAAMARMAPASRPRASSTTGHGLPPPGPA